MPAVAQHRVAVSPTRTASPANRGEPALRQPLARFCTGVALITGLEANEPVGFNRRYNDLIRPELQSMSWAGPCQSFYKDATGRIPSFYLGTIGRMRREFRRLSLDDCSADRGYSPEAASSAEKGPVLASTTRLCRADQAATDDGRTPDPGQLPDTGTRKLT